VTVCIDPSLGQTLNLYAGGSNCVLKQEWSFTKEPTTFVDVSGVGNVATCNAVTWTQLPSGLYVATFNGSSSYIDTGLSTDLSGSGDFTVMCWCKGNSNEDRYPMSQAHTLTPYSSDWIFLFSRDDENFWMRSVEVAASYDRTAWHLLGLVWDSTTETYEAFVDGMSVGTSSTVSDYGGASNVIVGARGDKTTSFFAGMVQGVRVWQSKQSAFMLKAYAMEKTFFGL